MMALAIICLLVPFSGKAYHIDDPLFVWSAEHIQKAPFDFYGFEINWNGTPNPAHHIIQNPPLTGYVLALPSMLFGPGEFALHLAMIFPAVIFALGVFRLAQVYSAGPELSVLAALAAPAFLVSATSVMADVLLSALYVWSAVLWIEGLQQPKTWKMALSGVLASMAALTKYFGLSLVPLLLVHSLASKTRRPRLLLYLLIPLAMVAAYQAITLHLYGRDLVREALFFTSEWQIDRNWAPVRQTIVGLAFVGGGLMSAVFFAPFIFSKRSLLLGIGCGAACLLGLFFLLTTGVIPIPNWDRLPAAVQFQFVLFWAVGVYILLVAVVELSQHRNGLTLTLFLWIIGTFVFVVYVNWTINARALLPMLPAVAVIFARRANRSSRDGYGVRPSVIFAMGLGVCLAVAVAWGDHQLARSQRDFSMDLEKKLSGYPNTIWFQGHWGFQYYMEAIGAHPMNFSGMVLKAGDVVVVPDNNTLTTRLPKQDYRLLHTIQIPVNAPVSTMNNSVGAGFYSSVWGILPFVFHPVPAETYRIYLAGWQDNNHVAILQSLLSQNSP